MEVTEYSDTKMGSVIMFPDGRYSSGVGRLSDVSLVGLRSTVQTGPRHTRNISRSTIQH